MGICHMLEGVDTTVPLREYQLWRLVRYESDEQSEGEGELCLLGHMYSLFGYDAQNDNHQNQ